MKIETPKNGMVGARLSIRDAAIKATGELKYVADMKLPHMLHGKILWSPVPHARIKRIDVSKALELPGVYAAVSYLDSPSVYINSCGETLDVYKTEQLFSPIVRYVGDKVAAVAAEDEKTAEKALKLIEVEYEELPANFDPERALDPDAYVIHTEGNLAQGNLIERVVQEAGSVEQGMQEADYVFEDRYTMPQIHHAAIETHVAIANYDHSGKLTVFTPCQDTFAVRVNLHRLFDLPINKIRVSSPAIGGAFGGKIDMILEGVAALLAMKTKRPVKIALNRREDISSTRNRHQMVIKSKIGVKKDGTIVAQDYHVCCNAGAYASGSINIVWAMCGKIFKVHKTKNVRFIGEAVITNTPIGGPMRGFGSPQMMFAQQRLMNRIANELGIDMVELQRKNLTEPDGVDYRFNAPHGNPRPLDCLEKALTLINYEDAVKEQKASSGRYRIGVGIGVGAHGNGMFGVKPDITAIIIKMNEDGSLNLYTGTHEMGNAAVTTQAQLVSEVLGVSMDRIECVASDTEYVPYQLGDYSSRGVFVSGHAAMRCAMKMKDEIATYAAELLGCDAADVDFHDNKVWFADQSVTLEQIASHARNKHYREIIAELTFSSAGLATSYGAHIAKVQVDTETGDVKVLDYVAVHDVGKAINPQSVEGQIEGAIQMGMGYAFSEGLEFDEAGKIKNTSFRTYKMPYAHQMPERIKVAFVEELEATGPFGAKSIGECSVVPSISALGNAVSNAIGKDMNHLPMKPEKILAQLA